MTGHLSVIYTVECQINFTLRLIDPILRSLPSYRSRSLIPRFLAPATPTVEVRHEAARRDSLWTQREARKLVWASGCVNWAVDPKTGLNNMMYPDWQYWYWFRSIFFPKTDFSYKDEKTGEEITPPGSWVKTMSLVAGTAVLIGAGLVGAGVLDRHVVARQLRGFDPKIFLNSLKTVAK